MVQRTILRLTLSVFAVWWVGCSPEEKKEESTPEQPRFDVTPPQLMNLTIEYGTYNAATNAFGAFDNQQQPSFFPFSHKWGGVDRYELTAWTIAGAPLVSPVDGIVDVVEDQTIDWAIVIKTSANSSFTLSFDHVGTPSVKAGDTVVAGQQIAVTQPTHTTGKVYEFTIEQFNEDRKFIKSYCPVALLSESVRDDVEAKITALMANMETQANDTTLFNEAAMVRPGCTVDSVDL